MNTVKDVIAHALELLDYDDSKVVGYKEMNNYLDKAWRHVNQTLINNGAHYFYRSMPVSIGANPLPWNFGQMSCIRTNYGTLVQRRTADMPNNCLSYDIIGNTLYITGEGYCPYLTMEYWEKPLTLTFPNTKQDITDSFTLPLSDRRFYKNYAVYMYDTGSQETSGLKINNWAAGETTEYEFPAHLLNFWAYKQITAFCSNNILYSLNYRGEVVGQRTITNSTHIHTLLYRGELYVADGCTQTGEGEYTYYFDNFAGKGIPIKLSAELDTQWTKFVMTDDGEVYYVVDGDSIVNIRNWTATEPDVALDEDEDVYGTTVFDDNPAIVTTKRIIWWHNGNLFDEPIEFEENLVSFVKLDWTDGYGAITTDGTDFYLESFVPDTALDFPNTLMYDYLSYLVAFSIAKKVGLQFNGDDAERLFIDSLDNSGDYPQIRNVYQY